MTRTAATTDPVAMRERDTNDENESLKYQLFNPFDNITIQIVSYILGDYLGCLKGIRRIHVSGRYC